MSLSKQQRSRVSVILTDLVRMSRDWNKHRPEEYLPLEAELREIKATAPADKVTIRAGIKRAGRARRMATIREGDKK